MKKNLALLVSTLLVSPAVVAQQPPDSDGWKSSAEIGFVSTSGNTETETLNARAKTSTERGQWRHSLQASALNSSDQNDTTAEKYTLGGQSDYKLEEPAYLFVTVNYEKDRFSGFDYQISEAVGYGRRVVDRKNLSLDLEIGPGARQTKLDGGKSNSEGIIRGGAKFHWGISDNSNFAEILTIEAGEDTTITQSETSLSSQVSGNLSMKLTLNIKNTSDVPAGVDKTDTETAVTLVYSF